MPDPGVLSALRSALGDRYRVLRQLGAGGMAAVYLADDLKHGRQVAIKVLRPELAAVIGAERFVREIRTIASLQHPHILGLIDSGEVNGTAYYVMPYVDGESLRDRLNREKQLTVADVIRIASEVASALDYAHRHGVIHRDIKPENVLLHDGQALVADFGIALAVSSAGGTRLTETGMSLGTPHYMSPEQAMGEREITPRSDIYALGAMTYEMLVGAPPFTGPTAQAIVAQVVTEEPRAPSAHRHTVPPPVESAVLTALQKLPADRFQSAAEFAVALTSPARRMPRPSAARKRPAWHLILVAGLAAAVGAAGYFLGTLQGSGGAPPASIGAMRKMTWDDGLEALPAISPDGRTVAYAAGTSAVMRVFVRQVSGGRAIPVSDDSTTVEWDPQWSGDGSRVLFTTPRGVFSAPAGGGSARQEVPGGVGAITGAAWSPTANRIAFTVGDTLFVREEDGTIGKVAEMKQPSMCSWGPRDLIACVVGNPTYTIPGTGYGNLGPSRIMVVRPADGTVRVVSDSLTLNQSPAWHPGGWLLYLSNRDGPTDVYGIRIADDGTPRGGLVRLTAGLGAGSISVTADGSQLAYATSAVRANVWSLPIPAHPPVPMDGATRVTAGGQIVESISVSGGGRWLVYDSDISGNVDVFRQPLPTGPPQRLTAAEGDEFAPDLSPDGRVLVYHAWKGTSREIFLQPLDGSPVVQLTSTPDREEGRPRWSHSGRSLIWADLKGGGIWVATRGDDGSWAFTQRLRSGYWASWSPDDRYLAYSTDLAGGRPMVAPADSGPPRALAPGSEWPRMTATGWSADGRTVYFKGTDSTGVVGIWSAPRAGGSPRLITRFDDAARQSERHTFTVGAGRLFFTLWDRQSDVWLMQLRLPGWP